MSDSSASAAGKKSEVAALDSTTSTEPVTSSEITPAGERLEGIDDIEFLLEEIENKIAPLALA